MSTVQITGQYFLQSIYLQSLLNSLSNFNKDVERVPETIINMR